MKSQDRQQEIDRIFLALLDLPMAERSDALHSEFANAQSDVLDAVEKLLEADREARSRILAGNPHIDFADLVDSTLPPSNFEAVGSTIGQYHLLQKLGEGGMGVVYMAEQRQPVKRRVALKVIKPGMDSKHVLARFEAERQALAMMDHPNIAKVLDVGATDSGRPFFVMELVKGVPITEYCDSQRLAIGERLKLFELVCQAVQHAHQKSVIHRDLKPSNILVAEYDDQAVPKVIDFGLAKALQHTLTEKTLFTQFGQVVGTFEYMSPEQAKFNQMDVDTRTDIYSLGVLLYELVTGSTPFDSKQLRAAALDEMLRVIREVDPPKPSVRLSGDHRSAMASTARQADPKSLRAQLTGDLDAIVMKSLEKNRTRRYESSDSFAADIRRLINNRPVSARPPSAVYLTKKFVSRHRVGVTTSMLVLASLVFGLIGMGVLAARNSTLFQEERVAREQTEELLYIADMHLAKKLYETGSVTAAKQILEKYIPGQPNDKDLRQFEWRHLWRLTSARSIQLAQPRRRSRLINVVGDGAEAVIADGRQLTFHQLNVDGVADAPRLTHEVDDNVPTAQPHTVGIGGKYFAFVKFPEFKPREAGAAELMLCDLMSGEVLDSQPVYDALNLEIQSNYQMGSAWKIVFSPDDNLLVTSHAGYRLATLLWQVGDDNKLRLVKQFLGPNLGEEVVRDTMTSLCFSPDGQWLAASSMDRKLRIWNLADLDAAPVEIEGGGELAFTPDGRHLIRGDGAILEKWDWRTKTRLAGVPSEALTTVLVAPPEFEYIVTGSMDGIVRLYDRETLRITQKLRGHEARINALAYDAPRDRLVTGDTSGHVGVYKVSSAEAEPPAVDVLGLHEGPMGWIVAHPSENLLATSGWADSSIHLVDFETGNLLRSIEQPEQMVVWAEFPPDGDHLVYGAWSKTRLWNIRNGSSVDTPFCSCPTFDPRGDRYMSAWQKWTVFDSTSHARIADWIGPIARFRRFSPSGEFVGYGTYKGAVGILDAKTGRVAWEREEHPGEVTPVVFSPDGKLLAACGGQVVTLWDVASGNLLQTFVGHAAGAAGAAFSPDGQTLATSGGDGKVRLWDTTSYRQRFTLECEGGQYLAFSHDGRSLAVAGASGRVWVWRTSP